MSLSNLQIMIPLTGNGSRFAAAGYERLKPFIPVHGIPMIQWVVRMFPGFADRILFICRQEHLDSLDYMRPALREAAPQARIFSIEDWGKQGPVADVLKAGHMIDPEAPVLVSYCDYYMEWDFPAFLDGLAQRGSDGAVPCYSGFHPHLLIEDNVYASCKVDERENLLEIREKFSWESDKMKARHSPGAYYMRNGALLREYYDRQIKDDLSINGEFYASLPYNLMVEDGLSVWCPANVSKFCQWGTPRDLEDYVYWTEQVLRAGPRREGGPAQ